MEPCNETETDWVGNSSCGDVPWVADSPQHSIPLTCMAVLYGLICIGGATGNGLVILVVLRFANMRSVTNIYIFNLAVSDFCFLMGLPFLCVTVIKQMWIFGAVMCKIFFIQTCLNWFTSVFTLTVLSADRYLAVCHAIRAITIRRPAVSLVVCGVVWGASLLVMTPVVLYATTVEDGRGVTCTIQWPEGQAIGADQAFIWYTFFLSFAIPVSLISVFYLLVVVRLRKPGPNKNTKGKKRSQKKVTVMVLSVITVYVVCWLPYWLFQITILFVNPGWIIKVIFQVITILSYCNSALNPVLYAFLSDSFRKTFVKAFQCASAAEVNRVLLPQHPKEDGEMKKRNKNADPATDGEGGGKAKWPEEPEKKVLIVTGSSDADGGREPNDSSKLQGTQSGNGSSE